MSSARSRADCPTNSGLPSSAPSTTKRTCPECVASPVLIACSIRASACRGKARRARQRCSRRCVPIRLMLAIAYQLPEAPPPPKPPPPPENPPSLEPEPLDHEPPDDPPDQ